MSSPLFCRLAVMAGPADKDDFACGTYTNTPTSVADLDPNPDPDPPIPRVLGPPGSGSGSISQRYGSESSLSKNSKKNLYFYCFVTYF
jgi:hypothetical protein